MARLKGVVEQRDEHLKHELVAKLKQNGNPGSSKPASQNKPAQGAVLLGHGLSEKGVRLPARGSLRRGFQLLSGSRVAWSALNRHLRLLIKTHDEGFENWLDRGLSATEAARRSRARLRPEEVIDEMVPSLPVVVDTPTSRMDRRHKGWSVTKFYPGSPTR